MKTSNFFRKIGIAIAGVMIVLSTSFTTTATIPDSPCGEVYARILHNPEQNAVVMVVHVKELQRHLRHGDRIINMFVVYNQNCVRK